MTATAPEVVTLTTFADVRDAYRHKALRQALYDEGGVVMEGCLLDLHGDAHRDRRRLENRLFRREVFAWYEAEVLPSAIEEVVGPAAAAGRADLVDLGYRTVMHLTALIAGVDRPLGTPEETDALVRLVRLFSEGATLVHSTGDRDAVRAAVRRGLDELDERFLRSSVTRRRALLDDVAAGRRDEAALPRDVLTTLLANVDRLDLPPDVVRREVAFYLQAGGHSTANATTHALDDLFGWDEPDGLAQATADPVVLQRCVHESLRLHPASPVAWRRAVEPVVLRDGTVVPAGGLVVLDLMAANRDPTVFGPDADRFQPHRVLPDGVARWGHTFGGGMHACIGMELDGGTVPGEAAGTGAHVLGTVTLLAGALLAHGARPDQDRPPVRDSRSARPHFGAYPVVFGGR